MRKNSDAWKSFFALRKKRAKNKLPPEIKRISPPRYWKDRVTGERKLIIPVRRDLYTFSRSGKLRVKTVPKKLKEKYGLKGPIIIPWLGEPLWCGRFGAWK